MDIEKNIRLVMYIVITYFLKWLLLYATITAYLSLSGCWCVYLLWEDFFSPPSLILFTSTYTTVSLPLLSVNIPMHKRTVRSPPALRCLCPPPFFNIKIPPISSLVAATTSDSITNAENIFSFNEIINLFPTN